MAHSCSRALGLTLLRTHSTALENNFHLERKRDAATWPGVQQASSRRRLNGEAAQRRWAEQILANQAAPWIAGLTALTRNQHIALPRPMPAP